MDDGSVLSFEDVAGDAVVLKIYQQVFAVLAQAPNAMIADIGLVDVDEAIFAAFSEAGPEGLTFEALASMLRHLPEATVRRRFTVLKGYRAIEPVHDRPHQLYYQATFAPYVMLLFLRRMADQGGQAELHQLLTFEHMSMTSERTTVEEGRNSVRRLTTVFRLLAGQLATLAAGGVVETLREQAQMMWSNRDLLRQAEQVHSAAATKWPELSIECRSLRLALAAYAGAVDAASDRLLQRAGVTHALGYLPDEAWTSFARGSTVDRLARVLDGFVFDAPAAWFTTETLLEAVESARPATSARVQPPRSEHDAPVTPSSPLVDMVRLSSLAEQMLGGSDRIDLTDLLTERGEWISARRLLADLLQIHQHDELPYELAWDGSLQIDSVGDISWLTEGWFQRVGAQA